MSDKKKLILIALNELNFDALKLYNLEKLSILKKICKKIITTFSEKSIKN